MEWQEIIGFFRAKAQTTQALVSELKLRPPKRSTFSTSFTIFYNRLLRLDTLAGTGLYSLIIAVSGFESERGKGCLRSGN